MIQIPSKLQDDNINFVLLESKGKRPIQKAWQKKSIKCFDPELAQHLEDGGNYGVMGGGDKHLVIVDFDNEEVQSDAVQVLPDTFTVKTGSGLLHKYFWSNKSDSFKIFDKDLNTHADIQGKGKQVVGPGSTHPNGNSYEVVSDIDIATIEYAELKAIMMFFDKNPKKDFKVEVERDENTGSDFLDNLVSNIKMEKVLNYVGIDTSNNPCMCPFHDSEGGKCLGFNDETAHCFHCDGSWNVISMIKQHKKCESREAIEILASIGNMMDELKVADEKFKQSQLNLQTPEDLKMEEKKKDFTLVWEKDLKNFVEDEKDWLIEKLIPRRSVGVWTGKRGTFKTFMVLSSVFALASSKDFLGKYKTTGGKILYLDKENGLNIIKERSNMIKKGMEVEEDLDIGFICFSQLKLDKNTDFWAIEELVKEEGIDLLVIDTYRRAISYDENDAGNVSRLFVDFLRPMAERQNISIILIHHDKKGNEGDEMDNIRGSSDLANYCDFILKNERKGKNLILKQLKLRNAPEIEPIAVKIDTDETSYISFKSLGKPEQLTFEEKSVEMIILWLYENNILEFETKTAQDMAFRQGVRKQTFYNSINTLKDRGILESVGRGKYKVDRSSLESGKSEQLV